MKKLYFNLLFFVLLIASVQLSAQDYVQFDVFFDSEQCGPVDVTMSNYSSFSVYTGIVYYNWYINDTLFSTNQYPETFQLPGGWYSIRLEALDTLDNSMGDYWQDIYIKGFSGKFFTEPQGEVAPGQPVQFFANDEHDWITWKFHDGTVLKYNWAQYVYVTEGNFPVKMTMSSYCGIDTVTQWINVTNSAVPGADIGVSNYEVCPNDEFILTASPAFLNEWTIGGLTLTGREIYFAFGDTGMHEVVLKNTNEVGNSSYDTVYIDVRNDIPVYAGFDPYFENPSCPNYEIKFEAHSSGNFEWDFGDGSTAFGKRVYNTYVDTGTYFVTLHATNGCGTQDVMTQEVYIYYDEYSWVPFPEFYFDNRDQGWESSITVCPYEPITVVNSAYQEEGVKFKWVIDSIEYFQKEVTHIFSEPGEYEIQLIAENNCKAISINSKWVYVDASSYPESELSFAPNAICPGEKVYFFDDHYENFEDGTSKMTYNIDFGDGTSQNDITGLIVDGGVEVQASHIYTDPGTYSIVFTSTNKCGNTDTLYGEIIVSDDPDRIPFYYVHNSASSDKMENEFENWGIIPDRQYTTFKIPVELFEWQMCGNSDSLAYVFFWYGSFDMNDPDLGPPNGYVEVNAPDTAIAYVPFNVINPSVGFTAVWYCNKGDFDGWPQVYTQPIDSSFMPIESFPTIPGETFVLPQALVLDGMQWYNEQMCFCAPPSNNLQGNWAHPTPEGYFHVLEIYEYTEDTLVYSAFAAPDQYDWSRTMLSTGMVELLNDSTLQLYSPGDPDCQTMGMYYYHIDGDNELNLTMISDDCVGRTEFLTSETFFKTDYDEGDYDEDRSGCPGDTIGFQIVGGASYEWHIQGSIFNDAMAYYVYADTGIYEEFVVATNNCGRNDTIYSNVFIGNDNVPEAYWDVNRWTAKRFEPLQFTSHGDEEFQNNIYLWNFGDGNYSTEKNPTHFYTMEGEYIITLTVSNGCGSNSEQQMIYITKETSVCEAKFVFTTAGTTVAFENKSLGSITSFYWEFGDGKVSNKANPTNTYPAEGVYTVSLTVFDSINNCTNQIQKQIMVGTIGCAANFSYTVNNITKTVSFNNLSTGDITEYYWSFGDGNFSTNENPLHAFPADGNYSVCLVTYDTLTSCMAEICKVITVGSPEIFADFSYYIDPSINKVNFRDISTGTVTNWYWDFGDGDWDTIPEPVHSYAIPGEYLVCLAIYNDISGTFADICKTIVINIDTASMATKADFMYRVDPTNKKVDFVDQSTGDITNWYWTFGDGTYQANTNVTHTYSAPGIYNVCLTVFSSSTGERSEICKTIQVGTLDCNINASFGYFINPTTKQVTFSDKSTGTAHKWFWDFGNGITSTKKNPIHTYQNAGFYLVSLAVRDTVNGCSDYYADFIQVGTADCKSDFNFTITDLTNKTVKFTNTATGNIGTYFWYFADGFYSTEANPVHSYNSNGLYSVSLTVADNDGLCFDYRVKDVQVGTIECNADFTFYIDSLTNTVYFSNQAMAANTSLYWLFGDGTYSIGPDPIHTFLAPGYYEVSLNTFNSGNGCMDYKQKVLLMGSPGDDVNADFIYSANLSTRTVKFSNKSNGQNLNYVWNFGDGTTSNLENPEYTYITGGYQFVCLTSTNSVTGMQNTTCKLIQVSSDEASNCLAKFNYDVDTASLTVKFADKSYGSPSQFKWDFGDGTTSTEQHPTKVYSETGYYLVGLKTKNTTTECESFEYEIVNVNAGTGIQAMFTFNVDTTAGPKPGGKPVDMIGVGHGGGSKLGWNFGDGQQKNSDSVDSTTLRPTHNYENPGLYEVCLIISDPIINQSDTFCDYVSIPYEIYAIDSICEGSSYAFFENDLTEAGDYIDTTTSTIGVDSIVYLTLKVNELPDKPTVTLSGTTLTATASSAISYQWYMDDTEITGATNQTYTATVSGNYTVVVTNVYGCYSVPSDAVNVVISGIEDVNPFSLKVFPNPLQTHTRIEYYLTSTQQISISLYDVAGNLIETIMNTYKPAGDHHILWKNPGLANGIYYLVLTSETEKSTTKLVIQK